MPGWVRHQPGVTGGNKCDRIAVISEMLEQLGFKSQYRWESHGKSASIVSP